LRTFDTAGEVLRALVPSLGIVMVSDRSSEVPHASPDANRTRPPETARVARAAFPKGNRYLRLADELDTLLTDDAFLALFPAC
jgi:hypothetical protein